MDNNRKKGRKEKIDGTTPLTQNINLGKTFLEDIDKCFPKSQIVHKLFNRNTVKLSYSCMPNVSQLIAKGNKKKLGNGQLNEQGNKPLCNCPKNNACPVEGKCLEEQIIYQAKVKTESNTETYIGLTGNTFKERFTQHKCSFNNLKYSHDTTLSKYIWKLKEEQVNFEISWSIVCKSRAYSPASGKCNLCITEIYYILYKSEMASLNHRSEIMGFCKHRDKWKLEKVK